VGIAHRDAGDHHITMVGNAHPTQRRGLL